MIKANIAQLKNRLSHYLRLVKGGEVIEVIDRKTPLARIIGIGDIHDLEKGASWVKEICDLGIVMPPKKREVPSDFSDLGHVVSSDGNVCGVLEALLDERSTGR